MRTFHPPRPHQQIAVDPIKPRRPLLTRADVASLAQFSERQIVAREQRGLMPAPVIKDGLKARYDPAEIDMWLQGEWVPKVPGGDQKPAQGTGREPAQVQEPAQV